MMVLGEPARSGLFSWVFTRDKADPIQFIQSMQRRKGQRGSKAMNRYVAMAERGVVSAGELATACLFDRFGITGWQSNVRIVLPGCDPYRADFLFAKQRLIVEADGWRYHSSRQSFEDDRWRDAQLQAAGYRVIRLTWNQVANHPRATAGLVCSLLAGR